MLHAKSAIILLAVSATIFLCQSAMPKRLAAQGQQQEQVRQSDAIMHEKAERAAVECEQKRLSGELKSHVESAQCSNPLLLEAYQGHPNLDLVQLLCAYRLAIAERNDKGEITEAEANVVMQELALRISKEVRQRAIQQQAELRQQRAELRQQAVDLQQQNNGRVQALGALLQGLGTWQSASRIQMPLAPVSPAPQLNPNAFLRSSPAWGRPIVCTPIRGANGVVMSVTCR
jgi:hypothetical protein